MHQAAPLEVQLTELRWFRRWLVRAVFALLLFALLIVLGVWLMPESVCGCEHDPAAGTPPPGQTPMATAAAVEERSYENTCDGAQAYFDDLWDVTDAYNELDRPYTEDFEFFLEYFRNSNPPPILQEWTDAQIAFWAQISDFGPNSDATVLLDLGDAIDAAEEELEDVCEGYEFTEDFWG